FVRGPTGTQDVLSAASRPGAFAILPLSSAPFAPYDPYYWSGSSILPQDAVHLSGGGGVPAGTYAVLPARYALLPGAYYVVPVAGYQDLTPGATITQPDGSTIVAGNRAFAGTGLEDPRTSGFAIAPGSAVLNLAKYTSTGANSFFAAQATSAGAPVPRLPQDAGTISLSASSELTFNATLDATAPSGGRGVAVDISSAAIRVVGPGAVHPPAGGLGITPPPRLRPGAHAL